MDHRGNATDRGRSSLIDQPKRFQNILKGIEWIRKENERCSILKSVDGATYFGTDPIRCSYSTCRSSTSMTDGIAFSINSKFTKTPCNKDSATRGIRQRQSDLKASL